MEIWKSSTEARRLTSCSMGLINGRGKREFRQMLTAVLTPWGHVSRHLSGEAVQFFACVSAPISPPASHAEFG